jgi:histidinol-phosphate aminotransferase
MVLMKKAYHGGGGVYNVIGADFEDIERGKDVANADGLDAWFDPSPKAVAKLSKYLNFAIKTSPPVHGDGLKAAISKYRGIPKENIIIGGGSSDLMFALFPNLGLKKVLILDPMYGEYRHIFENVLEDVELVKYKLLAQNNFEVQQNEFVSLINQTKPDLVVIVNPNSPSGNFLNKKDISKIIESIPKETLFVIDETYVDYVDTKESVETLVPNHKNLMVIKSMSKVYSLSGARAGYLVAGADIIEKIDRFIPPFSVSSPAQILAIEALKDSEYYKEKWEETRKLRENTIKALKEIPNIKIYSGEGNFFLIELLNKLSGKAEEIVKKLSEKKVFVRNADSMSDQFHGSFVRIAVKDAETNKKIIAVLKEIL